jgi:hypothetical protein
MPTGAGFVNTPYMPSVIFKARFESGNAFPDVLRVRQPPLLKNAVEAPPISRAS